ncbi:MAG: Hsp70 family protein [Rhizobiaceae bacterium]|nr:Hsp70 family protein [Rhizobiaceae bacterium]
MRWFRETFLTAQTAQAKAEGKSIHTVMDELAEDAPPGAEGLMFHPYLMGERSPYWDPNLRGDFVGLAARHRLAHFARAVLEGVAYSIRDCLEAVVALGQPIETLFLIGGAARSPLWQRILADVLGRPLVKPGVEDAAFGAAMVAGVAAGVFTDAAHAVECCVRTAHTIQPDAARTSLYERYFAVYRAITRDLAAHSHALVELASVHQLNDH